MPISYADLTSTRSGSALRVRLAASAGHLPHGHLARARGRRSRGRVFGIRELYVVDSGVLPTSLGVNPQISVMAMATRLAWHARPSAGGALGRAAFWQDWRRWGAGRAGCHQTSTRNKRRHAGAGVLS